MLFWLLDDLDFELYCPQSFVVACLLVARKVLGEVELSCEAPYEMYKRLMDRAVYEQNVVLSQHQSPFLLDAVSFAHAIGDIELRLLERVDYDLKMSTHWPELNGFPIDELSAYETSIQLARCLVLCSCTNPLPEYQTEDLQQLFVLASALQPFLQRQHNYHQTIHFEGDEIKLWTSIDETIHRIFTLNQ